jgi:hypothetical protein
MIDAVCYFFSVLASHLYLRSDRETVLYFIDLDYMYLYRQYARLSSSHYYRWNHGYALVRTLG